MLYYANARTTGWETDDDASNCSCQRERGGWDGDGGL